MVKQTAENSSSKTSNKGSATMQDIAKQLDISVATVSRALRNVPGINPTTRSQVMQTAAQLGYRLPASYRPNTQNEKKELSHIGVFIDSPLDQDPPIYLTGIIEASIALNASPVIHYLKSDECEKILNPQYQPAAMRAGLLSGAILIFRWPSDIVSDLSKLMPVTSIIHKYPDQNIDMVGVDNEGGIEMLIDRLYHLGHRKIGFFGRCSQLHWAKARFGSYVAVLNAYGIDYNPNHVIDVDLNDMSIWNADLSEYTQRAAELTRQGVTAWICSSEPGGWQLDSTLKSLGFDVPRDVSITGFHRPSRHIDNAPDITSTSISYESIGASALRRLMQRIKNPVETPRTILFPCEFYPGQSIGPAPR